MANFRGRTARLGVCILDCCFSGHAPARALGTAARPRSAFALIGIFGEGRILFAACAPTEAAWDQPRTGHGLLTYATIEAMSGSSGAPVSFPEVAGEIIRLARVEATRISVTQTAIFLGSVQGGLVFPAQARGANYAAAFPATPVHQIHGLLFGIGLRRPAAGSRRPVDRHVPQRPERAAAARGERVRRAQRQLAAGGCADQQRQDPRELAAIRAVAAGKKAVLPLPYRNAPDCTH